MSTSDEKFAASASPPNGAEHLTAAQSFVRSSVMASRSLTRSSSPDQIPDLEPLSRPHSEGHCTHYDGWPGGFTPPSEHHSQQLPSISQQRTRSGFTQRFKDASAPLKLSLVLENKGNVARDHLASERTYLAYVRTSLACASAGIALVQLFSLATSGTSSAAERYARPLGATVVLFGIAILFLGLARYFTIQAAMLRGYFPVARNSITVLSVALVVLVSVALGILFAETGGS